MQGLTEKGTPVWLSHDTNPKRKLAYTWQMVELGKTFVGMNTANPNPLVAEAIRTHVIPEFQGYASLRREVSYGKNSRIDILLESPLDGGASRIYIEVKNVHLKRGERAAFPSSVTTRGAKHMRELAEVVQQGYQAYIVYIVQRDDCEGFEIARDIDPEYEKETLRAFEKGVKPLIYACEVSPKMIKIQRRLEFHG